MRFREVLQAEFAGRKAKNARYSLRAFAALLAADHSTVSQILRGRRPMPATQIRAWARKLGLDADAAAVYVAAEHAAGPELTRRAQQLQHWTAEALAVIESPIHYEILRLVGTPAFQPDVRWIGERSGFSADEVNLALTRLLRLRLIRMEPDGWRDETGILPLTPDNLRKLALRRIREAAAGDGIQLGKKAKL